MKQSNRTKPTPVYTELATELCEYFADQVRKFIDEKDAVKKDDVNEYLFASPVGYGESLPDFDGYIAYPIERSIRLFREDTSRLRRANMSLLVVHADTKKPAFFVTGYINGESNAGGVIVSEQGESGTNYRNTLRWQSITD